MSNAQVKGERNYGIELFRIFSMLMIVILHINMNGGLMGCFPNVDAKYTTLWFGETFCFASVNCYALISGYVMYNHKATAGKLLNMWGQVFSISALTGLYFIIFKDANIPADKISDAFRPLTRSQYWYFTAYFGMYIIIPILNGAINWMEKELHKKVCVLIFIFFTIMPIAFKNDFFRTGNGSSTFWLSLMYIVGSYFGKYGISGKKFKPLLCGLYGLICAVVLTVIVVVYSYNKGVETGYVTGQFDHLFYTNPLIVLESIFFLMCFSQLKFNSKKVKTVIKWFASSSFSVYLIHVQPIIFDFRFNGKFTFLSQFNAFIMAIEVVLFAILIYIACTVADKIRLLLFKYLHINDCLTIMGNKLDRLFTFVLSKI